MPRTPKNINWRESPAHIDMLSKFIKPRLDQQILDWQYLPETLGENTSHALNRFIEEGLLVPASLKESLDVLYKVSDLKKLLQERKLSVSGNKSDLTERLVSEDEVAMSRLVQKFRVLKCSDTARIFVESFGENKKQAAMEAKEQSFDALKNNDPKAAYKIYVQFHRHFANQRFQSDTYEVETLQHILACQPKILEHVTPQNLITLKAAACMDSLWSDENPEAWLPDHDISDQFDNRVALNYLLCHARIMESAERADYAERVKLVFNPGDIDSCDLCRALEGQEFRKDALPNLPIPGCKSETGCQCDLEPIYQEFDEDMDFMDFDDEELEPADNPLETLRQLKLMLDEDLISEEEYQNKKKEILSRM